MGGSFARGRAIILNHILQILHVVPQNMTLIPHIFNYLHVISDFLLRMSIDASPVKIHDLYGGNVYFNDKYR